MTTLEITVPELVKRFEAGEIPANARAVVTYEPETVAPDSQAWDDETPLSGEELEAERRLFEQFEAGINDVRRASGMRTL